MKTFFNLVVAFAATMLLASGCNKEPMQDSEQDNTVNFTATIFEGGHHVWGKNNTYMLGLTDEGYIHLYMISIVGPLGEIDENGNMTIPAGTYKQGDESAEFRIELAMYSDKSEDAENPKSVTPTESTLVISENQIVYTAVIEGVKHVATYNGAPVVPADIPEADVEAEINYAYAFYTDNTSDEDVALFKIFFSDLALDEDGNILPNSVYYEILLTVDKLGPNDEIAVPAGRYEVGKASSKTGYIADGRYYVMGDDVTDTLDSDTIDSGYLIVNENGTMVANFKMYFSNNTHTFIFSGEVEHLENTIPSKAPYSTLTSDKACDLSDHILDIYWEGDRMRTGYQTYTIYINPNNSDYVGDNIALRILRGTEINDDISGKYTFSNKHTDFTAIPGDVEGFTLIHSWYYHRTNSVDISEFAPLVDGWLEIQVTDGEVYTITLDAYDDLNNNITGTFTYQMP